MIRVDFSPNASCMVKGNGNVMRPAKKKSFQCEWDRMKTKAGIWGTKMEFSGNDVWKLIRNQLEIQIYIQTFLKKKLWNGFSLNFLFKSTTKFLFYWFKFWFTNFQNIVFILSHSCEWVRFMTFYANFNTIILTNLYHSVSFSFKSNF